MSLRNAWNSVLCGLAKSGIHVPPAVDQEMDRMGWKIDSSSLIGAPAAFGNAVVVFKLTHPDGRDCQYTSAGAPRNGGRAIYDEYHKTRDTLIDRHFGRGRATPQPGL